MSDMAKLEIPSIVVHNGSNSVPGSPQMERGQSTRAQRMLSKQDEFEEVDDDIPLVDETVGKPAEESASIVGVCDSKGNGKEEVVVSQPPTENKASREEEKPATSSRQRSHTKVKLLVRSHAMREATSPPPDPESIQSPSSQTPPVSTQHSLTVASTSSLNTHTQSRTSSRHRLRHQGSSQGSVDSSSPCLSRDSSTEQQYTDNMGIDLQQFIIDTLHKNQKDRMLLLKIEQELVNLVKDNKRTHHKFPQMSSYHRMIVHRVGAFFGMDHNVDQSGNAVIVNKTKNTRLPEVRFREQIRDELLPEEPKRSILKRDSSSFEEGSNFKSSSSAEGAIDSPLRSHESTHNSSRRSSQEELRWSADPRPWSSSDSESSRGAKPSVTKSSSLLETDNQLRPGRLLKVESFENRDTLKANTLRPAVSKSYSFGGYTAGVSVLARGDSVTSTHSAGPRLYSKQDSTSSNASRLSPSSSGYKSQSQRSDTSTTMSTTPSPTPSSQPSLSGGHSQFQSQSSSQSVFSPSESIGPPEILQGQVMWAVTDMEAVPPGSVLINPQTGQPYLSPDGTVYRYDPANPPKILQSSPSASRVTSPGMGKSQVPQQTQSHQAMLPVQTTSSPVHPTRVMQPPVMPQTVVPPVVSPQSSVPVPQCIPTGDSVTGQPVCSKPQSYNSFQVYGGQTEVVMTQAQPASVLCTTYNTFLQPQAQPQPQSQQQQPQQQHMDPRHVMGAESGMAMTDLSSYFIGMSLSQGMMPEQGGAGDASQQVVPATPGTPATPATPLQSYSSSVPGYRPQQPQNNPVQMPVYFVPPVGGVQSSQQTARFMCPQYLQSPAAAVPAAQPNPTHQTTPAAQPIPQHQDNRHSHGTQLQGQYVPGYSMVSYGTPMVATGNGDCVPMSQTVYSVPSQPTVQVPQTAYTPTTSISLATMSGTQTTTTPSYLAGTAAVHVYPGTQVVTPGVGVGVGPYIQQPNPNPTPAIGYRAPTPPQTPGSQGFPMTSMQTQTGCNVGQAFPFLSGGYNIFPTSHVPRTAPPQTPTPTSQPNSAAQYVGPSLVSNFNVFRPNMQLLTAVRSSTPPPRTSTSGSQLGGVPLLTKSYSVPVDNRLKERQESIDKIGSVGNVTTPTSHVGFRFSTVPLYGSIPIMQGDMRLMGPPLQHPMTTPGGRIPFVLAQPRQRQPSPSQGVLQGQPVTGVTSGQSRPPKLRKQRSKVSSKGADSVPLTPQTSVDIPDNGNLLDIQGVADGLSRSEVERHLEELQRVGAQIQCFYKSQWEALCSMPGDTIISGKLPLQAVFNNDAAAQNALMALSSPKFTLRSKQSDLPASCSS